MIREVLSRLAAILCAAALFFLCGSVIPASLAGQAPDTPAPEQKPVSDQAGQEEKPEPEPEPEKAAEPAYFSLVMVGDCTLDGLEYQEVVGDDYAYPFSKTRSYFEDVDFTMANLECALTTEVSTSSKNFVFRAPPAYANIMVEGGIDFVTLGNNHVLDCGEQGYADTKKALDDVGVAYAGRDEWTIYTTESGLKIGVYALSFGTEAQIRAGIAALKDEGADFIIAALHWGDEGSYRVNKTQTAQAHTAIEAGADFVYGSHPHTLQPMEEYKDHYIFYSMGNWTFGGNTNPRDKDTILLQLTVKRDVDGTVSVDGYEIVPCACSGVANGNDYCPVPYEKDSEDWKRTLSKIDGTFDGSNLSIGYQYTYSEY